MARFQERQVQHGAVPSTGQEGAYASMVRSIQGFQHAISPLGNSMLASKGRRDAMAQDPADNPELASDFTIYGRAYNEQLTKGYLASIQNAANQRLGELGEEFHNDPEGFAKVAAARRAELVNEAPEEFRGQAAVAYDIAATPILLDIKKRSMEASRKASQIEQEQNLSIHEKQMSQALLENRDKDFLTLRQQYEEKLEVSGLPVDVLAERRRKFELDANLAVSKSEADGFIKAGDWNGAVAHIKKIRDGKMKLVFKTGQTGEQIADYLQAQITEDIRAYEGVLAGARAERQRQEDNRADRERVAQEEGNELLDNGKMTKAWVQANRGRLSGTDERYFSQRAEQGGGYSSRASTTDKGPWLDLHDKVIASASDPELIEAVGEELKGALRSGLITGTEYQQLRKLDTATRFKGARDLMKTQLRIGDQIKDIGGKARDAEATQALEEWIRNNPNASIEEALEQSRLITRSAILFDMEELIVTLLAPRDMEGTRDTFDIQETKKALMVRMMAKHNDDPGSAVTDPEFLSEMENLAQWERLREMQAKQNAMKGVR